MEKNNLEEYTKKLIQTSGLETPSSNLMYEVLQKISHEKKVTPGYSPLISRKTWFFIFLITLFIMLFIALFVYNPSASTFHLNSLFSYNLSGYWPIGSISKTMLYCFVFLMLFVVQVSIIKNFIEKSYHY